MHRQNLFEQNLLEYVVNLDARRQGAARGFRTCRNLTVAGVNALAVIARSASDEAIQLFSRHGLSWAWSYCR